MLNKLKKYPSYKDSEIEWLKEIPKHWDEIKIKHLFKERVEKGFEGKPLLAATQSGGVIKKEDYATNTVTAQKDFHLLKLVKIGDFVISLRSFQGGIEISYEEGIISPAYTIMKPKSSLDKNYFKHLFKSKYFIDGLATFVTGIREGQNIDYSKFRRSNILLPPLPEQTAIANFLDKKTAEIKEFIALKEKTIELLKERKMAIINELVTGKKVWNGTEWTAPKEVKDSGIEWLGEIPKHWEVNTIKRICKLFGRIGFRGYQTSDLVDEKSGAITLSPSNMKELGMDYSNCTYLSWNKYFESPEIQIKNGDILFVKTGSTYGKVAFVDNLPKEATINPQILVFKEIKINELFFYYFLSSGIIKEQVELGVIGGTIPTLSQTKIGNFYLSIPPLSEQNQIVSEIQTKSREIIEVIKLNQLEIDRIKEYQQSLISEVVTGKVDVSSISEK